jgi:hypothetical protein
LRALSAVVSSVNVRFAAELTLLAASSGPLPQDGVFNRTEKINAAVVRMWAEIVRSVPNSRIVIRTGEFKDETGSDACRTVKFERCGAIYPCSAKLIPAKMLP